MLKYRGSIKGLDFCNRKTQFLTGFLVSILYFLILLLTSKTSFANLQVPEGIYQNNQWGCTDFNTYYIPAKNFLANGVFGYGTQPDSSRPIGYQIFLALMIFVFGKGWIYAVYLIQSVLFALIYPLITSILKEVSEPGPRQIKFVFFVSLFSGMFFTRSVYIGPDAMLVFLLVTGIYLTIVALKREKWIYAIPALLSLGFGAQVRPTLILYPIINVILVYWIGLKFGTLKTRFLRLFTVISTALLIIICNLPSIRNYSNYGVFKSSIILSANYYDYLSKKILFKEDQKELFYKVKDEIESNPDISIQLTRKKEKALQIIKEYPVTTLKVIFIDNLKSVMLDNHLINFTSNFYGYNWKTVVAKEGCYSVTGNRFLFVAYYVIAFLYCFLYLLFFLSVLKLLKEKKYLLCFLVLLTISMFLMPSILIGDGGARFRLPFEWLIIVLASKSSLSKIFR